MDDPNLARFRARIAAIEARRARILRRKEGRQRLRARLEGALVALLVAAVLGAGVGVLAKAAAISSLGAEGYAARIAPLLARGDLIGQAAAIVLPPDRLSRAILEGLAPRGAW